MMYNKSIKIEEVKFILKLQALYGKVLVDVINHRKQIVALGKQYKEQRQYDNFEVFFSAVIRDALYRPVTICDWYDEYNCTDKHIINLFKAVLKDAGIFKVIG